MTTNLRVLLAEDHQLVRAGIRKLLESVPGFEVVAEASDGREALRLVRELAPDLVLTDIAMSGLNGMEATARITRDFPSVRTIVLSMHASEEYVLQALRAGAAGYIVKEAATAELELALRAVANGGSYLSPAISRKVVDEYLTNKRTDEGPLDRLTPRQREILQLVAEGKSTRDIAGMLHVSVKTVETHRAQLMERLDIYDVPGLVRYAIRVGMISPDK